MSVYESLCSRIFQEKDGGFAVWIPDGNGGRIRRRANSREKLEKKILSYLRAQGIVETDEKLTVREVFEMYNKERLAAGYVSEATATRDRAFFDKNFRHTAMESRPIVETTAEEWTRFVQVTLPGMTAKQWAGFRACVRGLLHYAEDVGLIGFTAEEVLARVRIHKKQFSLAAKPKPPEMQVFSESEMAEIKDYCRTTEVKDQWTQAILLLFATGARVGEIVCLKSEDIRPESCQIYIHRTETQYYSGKRKVTAVKDRPKTEAGARLVSVPESERQLLIDIKQQAQRQPWVFCRLVRGHYIRINAQGIRKKLYRICDKLKIPRRSPHKIRKTYASILLDASVDSRFIKDQLGHTDIATTEQSYHKNRKSAAKKAKILSQIPEING